MQGGGKEINAAGKVAHPGRLITDGQATEALIEEVAEYFGGIDLLINNAEISIPAPIDHADYGHSWERSLAVLLTAHTATFAHCRGYVSRKIRASSTLPLLRVGRDQVRQSLHCGKTWGHWFDSVAGGKLGDEGITVNCICPGPINGMTAAIPDDETNLCTAAYCPKAVCRPRRSRSWHTNFCLPSASFMTGVALPVDGGLTIKNA